VVVCASYAGNVDPVRFKAVSGLFQTCNSC